MLRYSQHLLMDVGKETSVSLTLVVRSGETGRLAVPLAFGAISDLTFDDNRGHRVMFDPQSTPPVLLLENLDAGPDTVHVRFTAKDFFNWDRAKKGAFGNYTVTSKFTQTVPEEIEEFSSEIVLPAGFIVNSIVESIPDYSENDAECPYQLRLVSERHAITIHSTKMKTGDVALLTIRMKSDQKSVIVLGGIVLLGVLYLIFFRDVLKEQDIQHPSKVVKVEV